jgi:hypothetical protein
MSPVTVMSPEDAAPPAPASPPSRWKRLWREHPFALTFLTLVVMALIGVDGFLLYKHTLYQRELNRLRAGMSDVERQKTDMIIATEGNRLRVMMELIRRQAQGDKDIHLAVAIDSGVMYLARDSAVLREMPVQVGPDRRVGTPPDTIRMTAPRGARTIERILGPKDSWQPPAWVYQDRGIAPDTGSAPKGALGPVALLLSGGAVIYTQPSVGPLADSSYILPGAIRVRSADLRAITPNLAAGMTVYLY